MIDTKFCVLLGSRPGFLCLPPHNGGTGSQITALPVYSGVNTRFMSLDATSAALIEVLHNRDAVITVAKLAGASLGTKRGQKLLLTSTTGGGQEQDLVEVGATQQATVTRWYQAQAILVDLSKAWFLLHPCDPFALLLLGFATKQRFWSWHVMGLRAFEVAINAILKEGARNANERVVPPTEKEMAEIVREEFARQG